MKVLAYPKDKNPYQELLYSEVRKQGVEVTYLNLLTKSHTVGMLLLPLQLIYYRLCGYNIFHLHWLYDFELATNNSILKKISRFFYSLYVIKVLLIIKMIGYKLVWTIHNIVPHEKQFTNDIFITQFTCFLSDLCILHSESTKKDIDNLNIRIDRIKIIPQGTYNGLYENTISRSNARAKLNINDNDFVAVFFGQIRTYKGLSDLLRVFSYINDINIRLLIIGRCNDDDIRNEILSYKSMLSNKLIVDLRNVKDDEIQIFMNAADVAIFPFKKITNSSSIYLAMAYSKAVIYPAGLFSELPDNIGYKYNNIEELVTLLPAISKDKNVAEKGINAHKFAELSKWDNVAFKTIDAYNSLY